MRIAFSGKTNKDYCRINSATFEFPSGKYMTIYRDTTDYDITDGNLDMLWRSCYINHNSDYPFNAADCDKCGDYYLGAKECEALQHAKLVELELEDDADEDYAVVINEWVAYM